MGANGSRTTDDDAANNNNKEQVVSKSKCWSIPSRRRRGANNANSNIDDDDEHYRPSTVVISKPKSLELNEGTNHVDPTLLGSAMLINSWKAPSTANMTPPVTPISTDSSCSVEGFSLSQPTQETLMQIIRCFPFPTPTGSSENSPYCERKFQRKRFNANNNNNNNNNDNQQQQSTATNNNNTNNTNTNATATTTTNNSATAYVERSRSLNCAGRQFRASIANVIRRKTDKEKWALEMENNGGGERTNRNISVANSIDAIQRRSALEKLAQVSVDTMAITALPLDCWLKERLKNWVQLSGHEGTIVPATDQTLWKRKGANDYTEAKAYRCLMQDPLIDGFVPRFYKEIDYKNESFIEIQDLTAQFKNPAIMDIKMGTRTFSECDVQNTTKRADLYEKMIAQNPSEPTDEERQEMAITKLRYMQFREKESSSALLGFRIEAAKMPGGVLKKSFKKVKTRQEVADTLQAFFGAQPERVRKQFLVRLRKMREAVERSFFFKHHEVVGSSLLLVYDDVRAGVWMIDFAKSKPVDDHLMNHRCEWQMGNHEDGYFTGLDNLINIIEELAAR